jgi:hypothetical protein
MATSINQTTMAARSLAPGLRRMSALAGPQDWKIVRLLPIEDGSYLYRIKCVGENVERVVKEGYLGVRQPRQ